MTCKAPLSLQTKPSLDFLCTILVIQPDKDGWMDGWLALENERKKERKKEEEKLNISGMKGGLRELLVSIISSGDVSTSFST